MVKRSLFVALVVLAAAACGPKPDANEPDQTKKGPTPEELAAQEQAKLEAPYQAVVQKFNQAVWELKPELLSEALTEDTLKLFMERQAKENKVRGLPEEMNVDTFLKQQLDYKIVYTIKSINLETKQAVVQGVIEGNVEWESTINFLDDGNGNLKIDHAEVLKKAIADLDATIADNEAKRAETQKKIETLFADHVAAIKENNPEMFESTISASTSEAALKLIGMLPKKEGGKKNPTIADFVAYKKGKMASAEMKAVDPDAMTVTVVVTPAAPKKLKKGETAPGPMEMTMKVVVENGQTVFDCSEMLNQKMADIEAAAAAKAAPKAEAKPE